jgi:hypothetical protein
MPNINNDDNIYVIPTSREDRPVRVVFETETTPTNYITLNQPERVINADSWAELVRRIEESLPINTPMVNTPTLIPISLDSLLFLSDIDSWVIPDKKVFKPKNINKRID